MVKEKKGVIARGVAIVRDKWGKGRGVSLKVECLKWLIYKIDRR